MSRDRVRALAAAMTVATAMIVLAAAGPARAGDRPDLSGFYNVATLTPLQRPKQFEGKATITAEEAKAVAEYWAGNLAKDSEPSDPNRGAPEVGGTEVYVPEFAGAAGGVGGYNAFYVDIGESNFMIDGQYRTSIITYPENGRLPELTEVGKARAVTRATMPWGASCAGRGSWRQRRRQEQPRQSRRATTLRSSRSRHPSTDKEAVMTRALHTTLLSAVLALAGPLPAAAAPPPDLSGTYNVATLTPLERPDRFEGRATISKAEAEAIAQYWASNLATDYEPSDPNRGAPEKGGTDIFVPEITAAAGGVGGYNAFYMDFGEGTFMIDGAYPTSIITSPANGRLPALTDLGEARAAEASQRIQENTGTAWWIDRPVGPYDDPELRPLAERCLLGFGSTAGPPALPVMYNNLKRIVQTDAHVMILNEMNHDARVVRLSAEHLPDNVRRWMGDSIGWWEGETLVVDTANFRDRPALMMAGRDLHVVERFTRVDEGALLYEFTVDDPAWTEPWGGRYVWPATNERVYEYACHEGNYAMGGILRGARLLEAEAADGSADRSD